MSTATPAPELAASMRRRVEAEHTIESPVIGGRIETRQGFVTPGVQVGFCACGVVVWSREQHLARMTQDAWQAMVTLKAELRTAIRELLAQTTDARTARIIRGR